MQNNRLIFIGFLTISLWASYIYSVYNTNCQDGNIQEIICQSGTSPINMQDHTNISVTGSAIIIPYRLFILIAGGVLDNTISGNTVLHISGPDSNKINKILRSLRDIILSLETEYDLEFPHQTALLIRKLAHKDFDILEGIRFIGKHYQCKHLLEIIYKSLLLNSTEYVMQRFLSCEKPERFTLFQYQPGDFIEYFKSRCTYNGRQLRLSLISQGSPLAHCLLEKYPAQDIYDVNYYMNSTTEIRRQFYYAQRQLNTVYHSIKKNLSFPELLFLLYAHNQFLDTHKPLDMNNMAHQKFLPLYTSLSKKIKDQLPLFFSDVSSKKRLVSALQLEKAGLYLEPYIIDLASLSIGLLTINTFLGTGQLTFNKFFYPEEITLMRNITTQAWICSVSTYFLPVCLKSIYLCTKYKKDSIDQENKPLLGKIFIALDNIQQAIHEKNFGSKLFCFFIGACTAYHFSQLNKH